MHRNEARAMGDKTCASAPPSGLLLLEKPPGPSSFALVRDARRRFGAKAGHAGTLDPFASGLLLVVLGRATRLARYLVGLDKRYLTEVRLGVRTSTGDPEGEPVEETDPPGRADVEALVGEIELPVPRASAIKVGGERAYRLHRRGVAVEMPLRRSTIHGLEIIRWEPPTVVVDLHVSSGTYVRAIAEALGGHCRTLRRTAVGPYLLDEADPDRVLPPIEATRHLPRRELTTAEGGAIVAGRAIPGSEAGEVALVHRTVLVAVARGDGRRLRPETVLV